MAWTGPAIKGIPIWGAGAGIAQRVNDKRLSLIAAGIAFYGILALFPALAAIIALWGLVGDPGSILPQIEHFRGVMPEGVYGLLSRQINALTWADQGSLGWATLVSLGLAIWSSRAGVAALINGLNAVYDAPNRGGISHYATALGLTVALIAVALCAVAAILVVPLILAFVPLGLAAEIALDVARWALAITVLMAGAGLVYRYGPNRKGSRLPWVTPGAVLAVLLWAGVSAGFSIYLANFGNYNEVHGSIGAVIALLMWLYFSGLLLLIGAALNAEIESRAEKTS